MAAVDLLVKIVADFLSVMSNGVVKKQLYLVVERALVALQRKQVIAALVDDLSGDLFLAAHRVDGDRRSFRVEQLHELGHRGDFIALGIGNCAKQRSLADDQALIMCMAALLLARSKEPRSVFPPMAIRPPVAGPAKVLTQERKQRSNASGSSAANTRANVSCEGMP